MWILLLGLVGGYIAGRMAGATGFIVFAILLLILVFNPALGAAIFLALAGLGIVALIIYLLPTIFFFVLGIVFVYLLIIGLGRLAGV